MERHAVLLFAFDQVQEQHELTVQTLETVLAQDIGDLEILLFDNGSTLRSTFEHFQMLRDLYWHKEEGTKIHCFRNPTNISPCKLTNRALDYLWNRGHDKVLCLANDIMISPNTYRYLNEFPRGMVCGSMTTEKDFPVTDNVSATSENTPMAMGIVRKWFYDALVAKDGYFHDENYFLYASDCDMALRMSACGIRGVQTDLQYWHHGSAHWKLLPQEAGMKETNKADEDRAYFVRKWGFPVFAPEYTAAAHDINFRGVARKAAGV
jgi:glycosyltransferase involved in cell wall biosynthesis